MTAETHVDPKVERGHLKVAGSRKNEILSGRIQVLDGETVMARARAIIE